MYVNPIDITYFDRQIFASRQKTEASSMRDFAGMKVCVLGNSIYSVYLNEYNQKYALGLKILEMPDGNLLGILQGSKRIGLSEITDTTPYLKGKVFDAPEVMDIDENNPDNRDIALLESVKDMYSQIIKEKQRRLL
jgi:hypothetical protein